MSVRIAVAVLLIALPIAFNVIFFLLQKAFAYPDILRKPTGDILVRFVAGGVSPGRIVVCLCPYCPAVYPPRCAAAAPAGGR
jgi:hypothetical protein